MQRRDFFKKLGLATLAVVTSQNLFAQTRKKKEEAAAGGDLPLVTPGQGMAASVNYVHNVADIKDAKLKMDRQGVKFQDQKCANCMLYSKHGTQGGVEVGKCQLFPNQVVKATGWCTSWAKKA